MAAPRDDCSPKLRCACPAKAECPQKNRAAASIPPSERTPLFGSLGPSPTATLRAVLGALCDRNPSFESLKHALSSKNGRDSLYALPIEKAAGVIDVLEQGSRDDSALCTYHQKRFFMMLRKMCREHKRLPPPYTITDELRRLGERPYGGGSNADVWRGAYQGSGVAIKVLRVNLQVDLNRLEKNFCREVVLWKQFKHPNLLLLIGTKKSPQTLMMISEWMDHGTIMDFIFAHPETNRLKLLADVARGVKYLHDWPSVHADLKSSNILIDSNCSARIADFGLTSLLRHPSISISVTTPALGGTLPWMAPELLHGEPPSQESDIYALGMVTYEVFAHKRPFYYVPHFAAPGLVLAGKRPLRPTGRDILGLSEDIWRVAEKCWDLVPSIRPRVGDILTLFETTSRDWVSPTSEAISNLCLGRPTGRNSPITASTDTMSETACRMETVLRL